MRLIPWNQTVFDIAYEHFHCIKGEELPYYRRLGFAVEALVQDYYGVPHNYEGPDDEYDDGYDMLLDGVKVDIKCDECSADYFPCRKSLFFVKERTKDYQPEVYLFVKVDLAAKKIALIGYLTPAEVALKGEKYLKGEYIPTFKSTANARGFLVSQADVHVIHKIGND